MKEQICYHLKTVPIMKNKVSFLLILIIILSSCSDKQKFTSEQNSILQSIQLGKFYKTFDKQINNGKFNNQDDADIFLTTQFSEKEIIYLCNNGKPRERVLFFGALAQKNLNKAVNLFLNNIEDKELFTWEEIFLEKDYDVSRGPVIEKWYYKIYDRINETQQIQFGNILIQNYTDKKYALFYENYLRYISHPPKLVQNQVLYNHIKARLTKNDIPLYKGNNSEKIEIVIGLANFKNENDVGYIKKILENLLVSDNYYMIDSIINNFPHKSYFQIFKVYYEKNKEWCVDNTRNTIEVLNQYPNEESKQIIEDIIKNYDFHSDHFYGNKFPNMTKEKYVKTLIYSKLTNPYFDDIKTKIKSDIDKTILENLYKIDKNRRNY